MVRYKNRYGVFCVRLDRDDEKKHVVLSGRDVYYAIQVRLFFFRFVFVVTHCSTISEFPECELWRLRTRSCIAITSR